MKKMIDSTNRHITFWLQCPHSSKFPPHTTRLIYIQPCAKFYQNIYFPLSVIYMILPVWRVFINEKTNKKNSHIYDIKTSDQTC